MHNSEIVHKNVFCKEQANVLPRSAQTCHHMFKSRYQSFRVYISHHFLFSCAFFGTLESLQKLFAKDNTST